jgi:hypothetical protein
VEALKAFNAAAEQKLQDDVRARLRTMEDDLNCRVYFNFYAAQGQAAGADGRNQDALESFRMALKTYRSGKARDLFTAANGGRIIRNILTAIASLHPDEPLGAARTEFTDELYEGLNDEIAHGAGGIEWASVLVKERLLAWPSLEQKTYPNADEPAKE